LLTIPEVEMHAQVGDWLVVKSSTTGRPSRRGEIVSVGAGGEPPFRVRWVENDHQALVYPGPDAEVITASRLEQLDREHAE
jgi:uncharacterized protein DUF1918